MAEETSSRITAVRGRTPVRDAMFELLLRSRFAAAHRLRGYQGSCERLHGHNWQVDVVLRADRLGPLGMVADFRDVKATINGLLEELDHQYLNELPAFEEANPTTENVAKWVFANLGKHLPDGVVVHKVTAWESENCGASFVAST